MVARRSIHASAVLATLVTVLTGIADGVAYLALPACMTAADAVNVIADAIDAPATFLTAKSVKSIYPMSINVTLPIMYFEYTPRAKWFLFSKYIAKGHPVPLKKHIGFK